MVTGVTTPSIMQSNIIGTPGAMSQHKESMPIKSDRRSNKPIMEKRRRARINNCLNELKTLILDATKKDPARHSKLEKADILEKTVKHLQELQRQQAAMQQATDPKVLNKFKAGFADCANEVSRFPGIDPVTKRRLLQHLSNCLNGVKTELHQQQRQSSSIHTQILPSPPSSPEQQDNHHHHQHHQHQHQHHQLNQLQNITANATASPYTVQQTPNGYFLPNGLQVIPTKLPNGSIALVLPHNLPQQSVSPHHSNSHPQPQIQIQTHQQQPHQQPQQQQQHQSPQTLLAAKLQQHTQHPMLVPIPLRTASTSSASSNASSTCGYEYNISSNTLTVPSPYTPPSPANSYEAMEYKPTVIQHGSSVAYLNVPNNPSNGIVDQQQQQQQNAQPLSLVVRKDIIKEEEQPWRPW